MSPSGRVPSVSVVIPTYNRLALLVDAIDSVIAQTMTDWELIVVDDGSTDGTTDFLAQATPNDPRIRSCDNKRAKGPGGARNTGVAMARGEIVAFLDSDDRWLPEKLEVTFERFRHAPEAGILATDYWRVDGTTRQLGTANMLDHLERWCGVPVFAKARAELDACSAVDIERLSVFIFALIAGCAWPQTSSILARRSEVLAAGGFVEGLQRCEELELWLRLAERTGLVALDEPLAEHRREGQDTMQGPRYATDTDGRYGDLADEHRHHIHFLHRLARGRALSTELRGCWHHRLRNLHCQIGRILVRRAPLRATYHLALGIWHRPKDLVGLFIDPIRYFNVPN